MSGHAFVTGAGGALGGAIARRLAADGFAVSVVDVDDAAAAEVASHVTRDGGSALAVSCDLREAAAIEAAFATATAELGPVRVLVNNAAVFPSGPFIEVTTDVLDDTYAVNQRAYFLCAQHASRAMIAAADDGHGGGSIVNVASIVWHGQWEDMAPYVAAKGAVIALTRALARELGPHEIRVNAVAPGAFPSRAEALQHADLEAYERHILASQALKRRGRFGELAAVVAFLCGDEASFVTGQTINVDGGWIMS